MRLRGFTLIEVLVVVAVVATLMTLAAVTVTGSRRSRLIPEAVERAGHAVEIARARAMLNGETLTLRTARRPDGRWALVALPAINSEEDSAQTNAKSREMAALPEGIEVGDAPPPENQLQEMQEGGVLALMLPDGRVLVRDDLVLRLGDESVRLRVQRVARGLRRAGSLSSDQAEMEQTP